MSQTVPQDYKVAMDWTWADWLPYYQPLLDADLNADTVMQWLADNDAVQRLYNEVATHIHIAPRLDTTDEQATQRLKRYMSEIFPEHEKVKFQLQQKLVACDCAPAMIRVPLRGVEASIRLYTDANLPLFEQESDIDVRYMKIAGAQTVEWEGKEVTLKQLLTVFQDHDRATRQRAWEAMQARVSQDRAAYNQVWRDFMAVRKQIYQNAGFENYRDYAWLARGRFDYTPQDALNFTEAIAEVVVPANERLIEKARHALGYETMRPWDMDVDAQGREPLVPYDDIATFKQQSEALFKQLDPQLGEQFAIMHRENLLDLENRKGKGPGGFCTYFPLSERPFIFMNGVGLADDVRTLIHEAGHAFHAFAGRAHPYRMMARAPMEFNEVASMAMELLAYPYLSEAQGGYLSVADTARFRAQSLRRVLRGWAYMAMVVRLQHWIYTHHDQASDPDAVDAQWLDLITQYQPGIDWSGYHSYRVNRWRRQLHIFRYPFYYIEYALARLGSVQVWANALNDQAAALQQYRQALSLGGTVTLPELYQAAGATLAFDSATLREAVQLIETTINDLDG